MACGCSCNCHNEEALADWPGPCAGCCSTGMDCACGRELMERECAWAWGKRCTTHDGYWLMPGKRCPRYRAWKKGALREYDALIGMGYGW